MSSKSPLLQSLRRIKPEKHLHQLQPRDHSRLPFLPGLTPPLPKLLLDTTVYIDGLQNTLPPAVERALRSGDLWHSTVTEAELSALAGLLDPTHPDTKTVVTQLAASIERRPPHRILDTNRDIWRDAGILAGLLARLQHYGQTERRKTLNDALLLLTAIRHGCAVLTRNITDFDQLLQLDPRGHAIFYNRRPA